MPQAIPIGLTQEHVLRALAELDRGIDHPFGLPTGYELVHDGKRYAPKAVVGLAFKYLNGRILGHEEFSGGEAPGQANYVLRALGFEVVAMAGSAKLGFITSRGFPLPVDPDEMAENLWFNMWQRRLWPYKELEDGDTLYWYDTNDQAIVWRSRVIQVERFEYTSKDQVRKQFQTAFGIKDLDDPYFDKAKDEGYCLAYKVDSLVRVNLPRPAEIKFPMEGWLRCSDDGAEKWLKPLPPLASPDGPTAVELLRTTSEVDTAGYFSPASLKDEREKTLREIVARRGQPDFRNKLIAAYGGRCAVTGCDAVAALEAAHIVSYSGPQSNHVTNGLLLRADIHTLFDLNLIGVDPESLTISVAPAISSSMYAELDGKKLLAPSNIDDTANHEALSQRWKRFSGR
jgi:5-methylcytosine-specific restriction enzyme A